MTAVVRRTAQVEGLPRSVRGELADAGRVEDVVRVTANHDVAIDATRSATASVGETQAVIEALMEGLARTATRLLIVGGAATLRVPGGEGKTVLEDERYLPAAFRPVAKASAAQLTACRAERRVDWAYLSPAAELQPGVRTGRYRLGRDDLLVDPAGHSRISMEDLAVVLIDEAERPTHRGVRFTAAY